MSNALSLTTTQQSDLARILIPADADKHARSRLNLFVEWQAGRRRPWYDCDLKAYRDHLLKYREFLPSTASAHLCTVRARYRAILKDNTIRSQLLADIGEQLHQLGQEDNPANRFAMLSEYTARLENSIDPDRSKVKIVKKQDEAEGAHVRLTQAQAEFMLTSPGTDTLPHLRDTVVIALMLCTGIREAELCALEVRDLRQMLGSKTDGGKLALHVRQGKGCKDRLIPYGDLSWVLTIVDRWLARAGITSGRVLRSFWKGGEKLRGNLSVRAIENIVKAYPVPDDDGRLIVVRPHDLRRTYARRQYESGMDIVALSQNLGHSSTRTTLLYIGSLGADKRSAKLAYSYNLTNLR